MSLRPATSMRPKSINLQHVRAGSRQSMNRLHLQTLTRTRSSARPKSMVIGSLSSDTSDTAPIVVVDGVQLKLNRQDIEIVPSFQSNRFDGQPVTTFVKAIDFSVNRLSNIEKLQEFKKLSHLVLNFNQITASTFKGLSMRRLENLSVENNMIEDIESFVSNLTTCSPALKSLSLTGNPCVPSVFNDPKQHMNYRYYIISKYPKLRTLDTNAVSNMELKRIQGKQIEPPLQVETEQFISPLDKEEMGYQVAKTGELTMMKNYVRPHQGWDPYWFVLGERRLMYYKDKVAARDKANPLGVIPLAGYQITTVAPDLEEQVEEGLFCFTIYTCHEHYIKNFYFLVQSEAQRTHWIDSFSFQLVGKIATPFSPRVFFEPKKDIEEEDDDPDNKQWDNMEDYHKAVQEKEMREAQSRIDKLSSFQVDKEDIQLGKVLGEGSFGSVFAGVCRGKECAIKKLRVQNLTQEALVDFAGEVELLSKIHHPHIILCMGACTEPGNLMIVTELMSGGDLEGLLKDKKHLASFSLSRLLRMCKDAALGINWLHKMDPMIIHRDIKPSNFLFDLHYRVAVGDFGLSEGVKKGHQTRDENGAFQGTVTFTAPEILKGSEFDESSDVYSFGLVLYCLYIRNTDPFPELESIGTDVFTHKIGTEDYRPHIDEDCPEDLASLMRECWHSDPRARPPFVDVISRLESVIVNLNIQDFLGRKFWANAFADTMAVSWGNFFKHFQAFTTHDFAESKALLKSMLCGMNTFVSSQNTAKVSMKRFGQVLQWFGPLGDAAQLIESIRGLVSHRWFHGDVNSDVISAKILLQPPGSYFVRFSSSRVGAFSLVYKDEKGLIESRLISRKIDESVRPPSIYYLLMLPEATKRYESIEALVEAESYLTSPCEGSPYNILTYKESPAGNHDEGANEVTNENVRRLKMVGSRNRSGSFVYEGGSPFAKK